jgi:CheY-like chemotaxis protein
MKPTSPDSNETILVVDDESIVRTLIEKMLTARGYTVLSAAAPEDALRLIQAHEVDAVVADVMMPVLSGPELVEEIRRHRPHTRALFTSGYPVESLADRGLSGDGVAFVQKPFTAKELTSRLRQLLDG